MEKVQRSEIKVVLKGMKQSKKEDAQFLYVHNK